MSFSHINLGIPSGIFHLSLPINITYTFLVSVKECYVSCPLLSPWINHSNVQGRIRKYVTNGSKAAVMDVIGLLWVSLGTSTVQLHDNLGSKRAYTCSEAGFSSQNGDSAWGLYYGKRAFCCAFLWAKGLNAMRFIKNVSCLWWEVFVA
jgi:hypothetical protein